jgi:hypothetical protein
MRIEFTIQTTCDFKTKTHGNEYQVNFQAHDEGNGEGYSEYIQIVRRGEPGLLGFLVAIFESAFETYGTEDYTHWAAAYVLDPHHPGSADTVAEIKQYGTKKAPRKRRYGHVFLTATTEWCHPLPFDPYTYRNPLYGRINYTLATMFFSNDFSPSNAEHTKEEIEEGYALSIASMRFFEKMAGVYEDKLGEGITLDASTVDTVLATI